MWGWGEVRVDPGDSRNGGRSEDGEAESEERGALCDSGCRDPRHEPGRDSQTGSHGVWGKGRRGIGGAGASERKTDHPILKNLRVLNLRQRRRLAPSEMVLEISSSAVLLPFFFFHFGTLF